MKAGLRRLKARRKDAQEKPKNFGEALVQQIDNALDKARREHNFNQKYYKK